MQIVLDQPNVGLQMALFVLERRKRRKNSRTDGNRSLQNEIVAAAGRRIRANSWAKTIGNRLLERLFRDGFERIGLRRKKKSSGRNARTAF